MTDTVDAAPAVSAAPSFPGRLAGLALYRLPLLAAGLVLAVSVLASLLVVVHLWRPVVAVPLAVLALAALVPLVRRVPAPPAPAWAGLACVAIAVGHVLWAALTHAEHVVLRRDAGSYALYTEWIASRHGLPVDAHLAAFGGPPALADPAFRLASPAFFEVSGGGAAHLVPQFLVGAPGLYSLGDWAGGWTGLLVTPAIVSGFALLALGGLTARLVGARWAPLAVLTLALAQPVLHAARSTYSEPPALLVLAAAAALLVDAVRAPSPGAVPGAPPGGAVREASGRRLMLAAGLGFGLGGLIRVDALREVELLVPVAAALALAASGLARPLLVGALGGTAYAALWAVLMSRPYLGNVFGSLLPLLLGGIVVGLLALLLIRWTRRRPSWPVGPSWLPRAAAGLVVLVGLVLAIRPLAQTVHQSAADPGSRVVAGLQLRQGLPVDGGRTYAEHTVAWVNWYLGPATLLLALLSFAALAHATLRWWQTPDPHPSRDHALPRPPAWMAPAFVGLASTVLTLYRPGITPDHPWADRRMVPVVLPALVVAAVAAVAWAVRRLRERRSAAAAIAAMGAAVIVVPAWVGTAAVAGTATEQGELGAVRTVCGALGPQDAVVALDARGSNEWPQVLRGICGRPAASIEVSDPADAAPAVRRIAARIVAAGHRPVLLAGQRDGLAIMRTLGVTPRLAVDLPTTEDQRYLTRRPDGADGLSVQVWLAPAPPRPGGA